MVLNLQARYTLILLSLIISIVIVLVGVFLLQSRSTMRDVGYTSSQAMEKGLLDQMKKKAELLIHMLSEDLVNPFYQYDMETIYDILGTVKEQKDVIYVYIYDRMGRILHDGTEEILLLDKILDDEVSKKAVAARGLIIQETKDTLDVAAPIKLHNELLGGVRVGFSLKGIGSDIEKMENRLSNISRKGMKQNIFTMAIITLGLSIVGIVLAVFVARSLSHPIGVLSRLTTRIGRGEYEVDIPIKRFDEIGDLANSIQDMAGELKMTHEELEKHSATLETKVAQRTAELQVANKELEAFSYSVSHDLQAPLRSIDGFSQALLEDYADKLDAHGKDYLQRVRAGSQRMAQLIDDLLHLSRVTRREMRPETVNLSRLAHTITGELQKTEQCRQVDFIIQKGLSANGDARLIRVVLENLLGNAWKFTGRRPRARIEFGVTEHDGKPAYFIRDNGAGFDMAHADKLFVAFQRLHTPDEFPGAGIGLATVQRIIQRHGGRVWAQSKVAQGATFYFTL